MRIVKGLHLKHNSRRKRYYLCNKPYFFICKEDKFNDHSSKYYINKGDIIAIKDGNDTDPTVKHTLVLVLGVQNADERFEKQLKTKFGSIAYVHKKILNFEKAGQIFELQKKYLEKIKK